MKTVAGAFAPRTVALLLTLVTSVAGDAIAAARPLPHASADSGLDAATYRQIATDLDAKAEHYERMAWLYRVRSSAGSKQQATLHSFARRHERLAEEYRMAAVRARKLAESKQPTPAVK
jgi:hypothetical protein